MKWGKEKDLNKILRVPVEYITVHPMLSRRWVEKEGMQDLTESIRRNGVLQPLILRYNQENALELISGYRRLEAAKEAGKEEVPCIIIRLQEDQVALFILLDHQHRKPLHYFEEAKCMGELIFHSHFFQEEACKRMGKAEEAVFQKIRLLHFTDRQQQKMMEMGLSEKHAYAILNLRDPRDFDKAVHYIAAKSLDICQTRAFIEQLNDQAKLLRQRQNPDSMDQEMQSFFIAVEQAIDLMKEAGVPAETEKISEEDCVKYIVKIPMTRQSK